MIITKIKRITDTNRELNSSGHLRVAKCILTSESVDDYLGRELDPKGQDKSIVSDNIYKIYRPLSVIKDALDTFNLVPITNEHYFVDRNETNKSKWLGTTGDNAYVENGKVYNDLVFWDKDAVDLVEMAKKDDLSVGWNNAIVMEKGVFNGVEYDGYFSKLEANHLALVENGRNLYARVADTGEIKLKLEDILKAIGEDKDLAEALKKHFSEKVKDEEEPKKGEEPKKPIADEEEPKKDDEGKKKVYDEQEVKKIADSIKEELTKQFTAKLKDQEQKSVDKLIAIEDCEKVLGKIRISDANPDELYNQVLKTKGINYEGMSFETKRALVRNMEIIKPQQNIRIADSQDNASVVFADIKIDL